MRVQSVRRQNRFVKRALLLLSAKLVDLAFLANREFRSEQALEAFETAAGRNDGVLKTSIIFE
jgi:hypothetical protein